MQQQKFSIHSLKLCDLLWWPINNNQYNQATNCYVSQQSNKLELCLPTNTHPISQPHFFHQNQNQQQAHNPFIFSLIGLSIYSFLPLLFTSSALSFSTKSHQPSNTLVLYLKIYHFKKTSTYQLIKYHHTNQLLPHKHMQASSLFHPTFNPNINSIHHLQQQQL